MIKTIPNFTATDSRGRTIYSKMTLVMADSFTEIEALARKAKPLQDHHRSWAKFLKCFEDIHKGNPKANKEIMETASQLAERALVIEPQLEQRRTWQAVEFSDIWCAGAIAENSPNPCFLRTKETGEPKSGKGDGAYRIIINTDHYALTSPQQGSITMGALVYVLSQYAPVEIWIQQGWLGRSPQDGITLFPIHQGHIFNPALLWFWLGDPRKDHLFSFLINRCLFGRVSTGVSLFPAIPCDLYLSSTQVGSDHFSSEELAQFVASTCQAILYGEEETYVNL